MDLDLAFLKRTWTRTWTCPLNVDLDLDLRTVDLDLTVAGLVTSLIFIIKTICNTVEHAKIFKVKIREMQK